MNIRHKFSFELYFFTTICIKRFEIIFWKSDLFSLKINRHFLFTFRISIPIIQFSFVTIRVCLFMTLLVWIILINLIHFIFTILILWKNIINLYKKYIIHGYLLYLSFVGILYNLTLGFLESISSIFIRKFVFTG